MEQKYDMQVSSFIKKYVKKENQARFLELMIEWDSDEWSDGRHIRDSFYDLDLLNTKHAESKEGGK